MQHVQCSLGVQSSLTQMIQQHNCRCPAVRSTFAVKLQSQARRGLQALPGPQASWVDFAKNISGEWEGVTAVFDPHGQPQPLPERFVPDAYREWGVELFDWQTQCSTLATPEAGTLCHRVRRMMPTVGCEADAVAYTEDAETLWKQDARSELQRTVLGDGSYFAGTYSTAGADRMRLEVCFMELQDSPEPRSRIRVITHVTKVEGTWQVNKHEVHQERFEAPYQGGIEQLIGCGGGMDGFANTRRTDLQDAAANGWVAVEEHHIGSAHPASTIIWRSEAGMPALLPLGLFAKVMRWSPGAGAPDDLAFEVGRIVGDGRRRVARATYELGKPTSFYMILEERRSLV